MDLTTHYMGLTLRNPLVASPTPLNSKLDHLKALDKAGIGAVVLPSLFEEQLIAQDNQLDMILAQGEANNPEAQSYFPDMGDEGPYGVTPYQYLELIKQAKQSLSVPVIASLNGCTPSGWIDYAKQIEEAGADALELNIYYVPVDMNLTGDAIEQRYLNVLKQVKEAIRIPVSVKMPPYFSSIANMAKRLEQAGADGLVIFNRYLQPDIDLLRMQISSELELSHPSEMRLSLLWTAVLCDHVKCSLAGSIGVESVDQVIKYLLVGSDVVMTASSILRHGPHHVAQLLSDLETWMTQRQVDSVNKIRGLMSRQRIHKKGIYERANYIHLIEHYSSQL